MAHGQTYLAHHELESVLIIIIIIMAKRTNAYPLDSLVTASNDAVEHWSRP